jgi:hypothetical protein
VRGSRPEGKTIFRLILQRGGIFTPTTYKQNEFFGISLDEKQIRTGPAAFKALRGW